mgnify:CR=1 FL=1
MVDIWLCDKALVNDIVNLCTDLHLLLKQNVYQSTTIFKQHYISEHTDIREATLPHQQCLNPGL